MSLPAVGIIGPGRVGTTLGGQLLSKGFKVAYGSRDPDSDKVKKILEEQPSATADTTANVIAASDVLFLTTPGLQETTDTEELAAYLGEGIKGKILIDATNPMSDYPHKEYPWGRVKSGGEVLADALPRTYVYKAFNSIFYLNFTHPEGSLVTGERLSLLFAGPPEKKDVVHGIIDKVGFIPYYVGPIRYARNLEAMTELVVHLMLPGVVGATENWGTGFHLQVIKKPE